MVETGRGPEPTVFDRRAAGARPGRARVSPAPRTGCFWLDGLDRPAHPELVGQHAADLVIIGAGYTGLWTAIRAKERDPGRRVIIVEACEVGWAASGRNGGFCEASLTHGEENGRSRWAEEYDELERLGRQNLDDIEATVARYAMDVRARTHRDPVGGHRAAPDRLAGRGSRLPGRAATRALVNSPTYPRRILGPARHRAGPPRASWHSSWPGWRSTSGCRSSSGRRSRASTTGR